ncbi:UNVERIFIED_CONTAM: hypothetical protein FKN15_028402 [Acipenser sinensis]
MEEKQERVKHEFAQILTPPESPGSLDEEAETPRQDSPVSNGDHTPSTSRSKKPDSQQSGSTHPSTRARSSSANSEQLGDVPAREDGSIDKRRLTYYQRKLRQVEKQNKKLQQQVEKYKKRYQRLENKNTPSPMASASPRSKLGYLFKKISSNKCKKNSLLLKEVSSQKKTKFETMSIEDLEKAPCDKDGILNNHCHDKNRASEDRKIEQKLAKQRLWIVSAVCMVFMVGEIVGQNEPEPQGSFPYGGSGAQPYRPAQLKIMDIAELIRTLEKSTVEMQEATRKQNECTQQWRQEWGLPTWEQEFPVSQLQLVLQKLVWLAPQQESLVPEPEPELQALEPELPAPERKPAVPELQQELQLSEEEELPPPKPEGEELPELQQELQLY